MVGGQLVEHSINWLDSLGKPGDQPWRSGATGYTQGRQIHDGGMSMDPVPDYDGSDELEYFFSWLPWALRGTDWTGTPAYPPV